jgi:lipopolysaccharide transport system ATP-binding protein
MSDLAIRVENLSKRYDITVAQNRYDTLRDQIADSFKRLFHRNGHVARGRKRATRGERIWALKDVSFDVRQGEVIGIIGRNGAGKSTLLKILSRITVPTEGRAEIYGRVGSLLEVGTGFHPELSGRENIYLNGAILGMRKKEIDRRFDEIVAFAEIEKFIDTPVKHYSSGMYMRLAFAVAAHLEPEILIVDEVLAVGDAAFQKKCLGKMSDVASEGITVLFVSHNMSAVARLCNWALLVDHGRIVEQGSTQDVVEKYLTHENGKTCHVKFPPDPSRQMRLRELTILNAFGIPSSQINMSETFRVRVSYDVNRTLESAHVICFFCSADGTNIFGTGDADCRPERLETRHPGHYCAEFEVPRLLLGEGQYSITVALGIPFVQNFERHENLVRFEIVDLRSESRHWAHRRRPGILGIQLPWTYKESYYVEEGTHAGF